MENKNTLLKAYRSFADPVNKVSADLYDRFSKNPEFNQDDWLDSLKENSELMYFTLLENNSEATLPKEYYDPFYSTKAFRMMSLYKNFADDTKKEEREFVETDIQTGEDIPKKLGKLTEKEFLQYQLDYYLKYKRLEWQYKKEQEDKKAMSTGKKIGHDIAATLYELGTGVLQGLAGIFDIVGGIGTTLYEGFAGKDMSEAWKNYFADDSFTALIEKDIRPKLYEYERLHTHFMNLDQEMTSVGEVFIGVSNSIGRLVPAMVTAGAAGVASAGGAAAAGQLATPAVGAVASGATSVATATSVKAIASKALAWKGIGTTTFYSSVLSQNLYENFTDERLSGSVAFKTTNALLKASAEALIEVALGKILGSTVPNKLIGIGGKTRLVKLGRLSGPGFVIKSALQEGLEEFLQDLGTHMVDKFTNLFAEGYGADGLTLEDLGNSFTLGALSSLVLSGASMTKNSMTRRNISYYQTKDGKVREIKGSFELYYRDAFGNLEDALHTLREEGVNKKTEKLAIETLSAIRTLSQFYSAFDKEQIQRMNIILNTTLDTIKGKDAVKIDRASHIFVKAANVTIAGMLNSVDFTSYEKKSIKDRITKLFNKDFRGKASHIKEVIANNKSYKSDNNIEKVAKTYELETTIAEKEAALLDKKIAETNKEAKKEAEVDTDFADADYLDDIDAELERLTSEYNSLAAEISTPSAFNTEAEPKKIEDQEKAAPKVVADERPTEKTITRQKNLEELQKHFKFIIITDGGIIAPRGDTLYVSENWLTRYSSDKIRAAIVENKILADIVTSKQSDYFLGRLRGFAEGIGDTASLGTKSDKELFLNFLFNEKFHTAFVLNACKTDKDLTFLQDWVFNFFNTVKNLSEKYVKEDKVFLEQIETRMREAQTPGTLLAIVLYGLDPQQIGADSILSAADLTAVNKYVVNKNIINTKRTNFKRHKAYENIERQLLDNLPEDLRNALKDDLRKEDPGAKAVLDVINTKSNLFKLFGYDYQTFAREEGLNTKAEWDNFEYIFETRTGISLERSLLYNEENTIKLVNSLLANNSNFDLYMLKDPISGEVLKISRYDMSGWLIGSGEERIIEAAKKGATLDTLLTNNVSKVLAKDLKIVYEDKKSRTSSPVILEGNTIVIYNNYNKGQLTKDIRRLIYNIVQKRYIDIYFLNSARLVEEFLNKKENLRLKTVIEAFFGDVELTAIHYKFIKHFLDNHFPKGYLGEEEIKYPEVFDTEVTRKDKAESEVLKNALLDYIEKGNVSNMKGNYQTPLSRDSAPIMRKMLNKESLTTIGPKITIDNVINKPEAYLNDELLERIGELGKKEGLDDELLYAERHTFSVLKAYLESQKDELGAVSISKNLDGNYILVDDAEYDKLHVKNVDKALEAVLNGEQDMLSLGAIYEADALEARGADSWLLIKFVTKGESSYRPAVNQKEAEITIRVRKNTNLDTLKRSIAHEFRHHLQDVHRFQIGFSDKFTISKDFVYDIKTRYSSLFTSQTLRDLCETRIQNDPSIPRQAVELLIDEYLAKYLVYFFSFGEVMARAPLSEDIVFPMFYIVNNKVHTPWGKTYVASQVNYALLEKNLKDEPAPKKKSAPKKKKKRPVSAKTLKEVYLDINNLLTKDGTNDYKKEMKRELDELEKEIVEKMSGTNEAFSLRQIDKERLKEIRESSKQPEIIKVNYKNRDGVAKNTVLISRYIKKSLATGTNLEYFYKPGGHNKLDKRVQAFVLGTTAIPDANLPPVLLKAIKEGLLTLTTLREWIRTVDLKEMTLDVFDLVCEHIYNNDNIASPEELDRFVDEGSLERFWITIGSMTDKNIDLNLFAKNEKLSLTDYMNFATNYINSQMTASEIKKRHNLLFMRKGYNTYEKSSGVAKEGAEVKEFDYNVIKKSKNVMKTILLSTFDGSFTSLLYSMTLFRRTLMHNHDSFKMSRHLKSLDQNVNTNKGETGSEFGNFISKEDVREASNDKLVVTLEDLYEDEYVRPQKEMDIQMVHTLVQAASRAIIDKFLEDYKDYKLPKWLSLFFEQNKNDASKVLEGLKTFDVTIENKLRDLEAYKADCENFVKEKGFTKEVGGTVVADSAAYMKHMKQLKKEGKTLAKQENFVVSFYKTGGSLSKTSKLLEHMSKNLEKQVVSHYSQLSRSSKETLVDKYNRLNLSETTGVPIEVLDKKAKEKTTVVSRRNLQQNIKNRIGYINRYIEQEDVTFDDLSPSFKGIVTKTADGSLKVLDKYYKVSNKGGRKSTNRPTSTVGSEYTKKVSLYEKENIYKHSTETLEKTSKIVLKEWQSIKRAVKERDKLKNAVKDPKVTTIKKKAVKKPVSKKTKVTPKGRYITKIESEISVESTTEIPEILTTIFKVSFSDFADTKVQYISEGQSGKLYEKGDKKFKSMRKHEIADFGLFMEANQKTFENLDRKQVMEIIDFLDGDYKIHSSLEAANKINMFKIYTLAFIIDALRHNYKGYNVEDNYLHRAEKIYERSASQAGSTLRAVGQMTKILNPLKQVIKSSLSRMGLDEADLENFSNAVMVLGYTEADLNASKQRLERLKRERDALDRSYKKAKERGEHTRELKKERDAKRKECKIAEDTHKTLEKSTNVEKSVAMEEVMKQAEALTKLFELKDPTERGWGKRVGEKITTYRYTSMLSSPVTWIRNLISNVTLTGLNRVSEKVAQVIFSKKEYATGQIDMSVKPTEEVKDFIKMHIIGNPLFELTYDGMSRYDNHQNYSELAKRSDEYGGELFVKIVYDAMAKRYKATHAWDNDLANTMTNLVRKAISDKFFIEKAANQYFARMLTSEIKAGRISLNFGLSNKVLNLFAEAVILANFDYMHKPSGISAWLEVLKEKYPAFYKVLTAWQPFLNSQWNWFVETLKFSPLGLIGSIYRMSRLEKEIEKAEQKIQSGDVGISPRLTEFVIRRDVGKGVVGSLGWVLGAILAALGLIRIEEDDTKFYMYIKDLRIDISAIFGSSSLLVGASITQLIKEETSAKDGMGLMVEAALDDFVLYNLLSRHKYASNFYDSLLTETESMMRSMVPQMAQLLIRFTNNKKIKYTPGMAGMWERWLNSFIPAQPLGRRKIDVFTGEEMSEYAIPVVGDFLNSGLLGAKFFWRSPSEQEKLYKQYTEGTKNMLTGDIGNKKLNNKRTLELNKKYGELNALRLKEIQNKTHRVLTKENRYKVLHWDELDADQRRRVIERTMTENSNMAKVYIWVEKEGGKYYTTPGTRKLLKTYNITKNVYTGDKGFVE